MLLYPDEWTLSHARSRYFEWAGIEPGYGDRWVRLKAGPFRFAFPNTKARVRAVKLHDLHHVATGYETTWTGEAEIGAWEIASGCADFLAAWYLNLGAFTIGLFIAPRAVFEAFVRGRHTENLYRLEGKLRPALLESSVGDLRQRLGLSPEIRTARPLDGLAFVGWCLIGLAGFVALPAAVLLLVL